MVLHPESRVLWDLVRCADLARHDRVSVYVLSKESILRAAEAGLTADQIKAFLNANTGKGVPQNVAHSIDDWSRLVRRATIRRATLIEVPDAAILDEMVASRKTRRYVAQRLSPTVAVVNLPEVGESAREDPWQKLLKELKGAGYSPTYANGETVTSESAPTRNGAANGHETAADGALAAGRKATVSRVRKSAGGRSTSAPTGKTGTR
jgi:hypothetical protein